MSCSSAASATERGRKPYVERPVPESGGGAPPGPALRPTSPQQAAGMRMDPAPSEAVAAAHRPAATAAPLPPLEPPGVRSRSHGLRVAPYHHVSVTGMVISSGTLV